MDIGVGVRVAPKAAKRAAFAWGIGVPWSDCLEDGCREEPLPFSGVERLLIGVGGGSDFGAMSTSFGCVDALV